MPAPTRKFAPVSVETTTRSFRQQEQEQDLNGTNNESNVKRRRFLPEPVETTHRSSKDSRPGTPETGDLHHLKHEHKMRRFVPELVESTSTSDKVSGNKEHTETTKAKTKPRKFAVEAIETTRKSSSDKKKEIKPQSRFKPELVETIHRKSNNEDAQQTDKPVRKFAPVLIDTAKRSRKAGDSRAALTLVDKTEQGHTIAAREHRRHITGTATPMDLDVGNSDENAMTTTLDLSALNRSELRPISPFDGSAGRARSQQRQHSFRCPDLDTIESSESDRESDTSSSPAEAIQGSPITASDSSFNNEYKHATRIRESIDENFANYFLQLEAKRAEKRLREQALAAFPNSDFHEPIQHYVDVEKDSDSDVSIDYRPVTYDGDEDDAPAKQYRRESTKVPWEQMEMQRHAERMDQERKANQITSKQTQGPWWSPGQEAPQADREMRSMRDRARPPMLGSDITFPRCRSPDTARFDVTQGSTALRNQMCYLTEHAEAEAKRSSENATAALWSDPSTTTHQNGLQTTVTRSSSSAKGLWGGFCVGDTNGTPGGLTAPIASSGLVTPRHESFNPFEKSFVVPNHVEMGDVVIQTPPTPSKITKNFDIKTIDGVLLSEQQFEKMVEEEFPDSFVTQVYNYLSLGYPSLARPFDEELSKISRVSIADLRHDDQKAKAAPKGYIRLGSDFEGGGGVERNEDCMRWTALKQYIREWARQEKTMAQFDSASGGNWATTARRGSWGI